MKRVASWVRVSVVGGVRGTISGAVNFAQRAHWRLSPVARMRSSRDAVGILKLWGNHLMVSAMRVELVGGFQILWQR